MNAFKTFIVLAGLLLAGFVVTTDFFLLAPVWAQAAVSVQPPGVEVPIGDWIGAVLLWAKEFGALALGSLVVFICRKLPAQLGNLILAFLTEQTIGRGVDWMFATVEGYARGRVLTLPQTNAAIAAVEAYVIANAPTLARWLGETLRPKIVARLSEQGVVPPEASEATLDATLPVPAV